jgi:hypothetical protein
MSLEKFASRGLKAQQAVDELAAIASSSDRNWLHSIATDADRPMTVRNAASRQLRVLAATARRASEKR